MASARWQLLWLVAGLVAAASAHANDTHNERQIARHKNLDAVQFGDPFVEIGGTTLLILSLRVTNLPVQALSDIHTRPGTFVIILYSETAPLSDDGLWQIPPSISALSNLVAIVAQNALRGSLPSQIGTLTSLSYFASTRDQLSGDIPSQLGLLTNLQQVVMSESSVSSSIPRELQGLTNCLDLQFHDLGLSGTFPSQLARMSSLRFVSVLRNSLEGPLPSQLATLDLRWVSFGDNPVSGPIPSQWGLLAGLLVLDLRETSLEGPVPSQLGGLTALTSLEVHRSLVSGALPSQLGRLVDLELLDFSRSQVTALPSQLARATALQFLDGRGAKLSGRVPSQLGCLRALRFLNLGANELAGAVPSELGQATALTDLVLSQNRLRGEIPSQIGQLTNLARLEFVRNELEGRVPSQLALLVRLEVLTLADNRLNGRLPRQLFQHLTALTSVSLARNSFSGSLPDSAAAGVWGQACADAGLDNAECPNQCRSCTSPRVRLKDCDRTGVGDWCVHCAWLVALAAVVGVFAAVGFAVTNRHDVRAWHRVARSTGMSLYAACKLFVDVIFAANASSTIFPWAVLLLVVAGLGSLALAAHTLRRAQLSPLALALGCLLGTVDVGVLERVIPAADAPPFMAQSIILIHCVGAVGEGTLQAISLLHKPTTINVLAFSLSLFSVLGLAAVGSVIALTRRYHSAHIFTSAGSGVELSTSPFGGGDGKEPSKTTVSLGEEQDAPNEAKVGASGGGGGGGSRERRVKWCPRWLRVLLGLAPVVALLAGVGRSSGGDRGDGPTGRTPATMSFLPRAAPVAPMALHDARYLPTVPRSTAGVDWTQPTLRVPERGGQKTTTPDCGGGFAFSDSFLCILGEVWAVVDTTASLTNLEDLFPAIPCAQLVLLPVFGGGLPSQIALLQRLQVLMLGFVESTALPSEIGSVGSLENFVVARSSVETLPTQMGRLSNLFALYLSDVPLSTLPSELGLAPLELLLLFETGPTALPSQIAGISSLSYIGLHNVRHPVPSQLGLTNAIHLELTNAVGGGRMPSQLALVTTLSVLNLERAELRGDLGEVMKRMTHLASLNAKYNHLSGTIPSELSRHLHTLDVSHNALTGTLPSQLALASSLAFLQLGDNLLTGGLPTQLGLLTLLTHLDLHGNRFVGGPPPSLAGLQSMKSLLLHDNGLSGLIPSDFALLPATMAVQVEHNDLTGTLPSQMSEVQKARWLEACDYSGLEDRQCARECRECALHEIQTKGCDARGYDNHCLQLYWVLLASAVGAFAMRLWVSTLGGGKPARSQVLVSSLLSTLVAVHQFLIAFFLLDAEGVIQALSIAVVCVALATRYLLTVDEFVKNGHHDTINTQHKLFSLAVVFCVMDPFTLVVVSTRKLNTRHDQASAMRLLRWCVAVALMEDVPMLVLQAVVVGTEDSPPGIATQALVATALSLLCAVREWMVHTTAFAAAVTTVRKRSSAAALAVANRTTRRRSEQPKAEGGVGHAGKGSNEGES